MDRKIELVTSYQKNLVDNQSGSKDSSSFLIFALLLMIMVSIAVLLPLFPNDFFPYLRIGQQILETGRIPATEFMTFTRFGEPAVYLYWLPSLIFLGVYQWGGVTLISLLTAICVAIFYSCIWLGMRELRVSAGVSALVLLATGLIGVNYWATRPQLLTYPIFGLALLILLRWQTRDEKKLWLMPLLAMLWANLHGSFLVLFFLLGPALIFGSGNRKKLFWVTLACLAATCINRYGFDVWASMFSMVNSDSIRSFSVEWRVPENVGWQNKMFFALFLLVPVLTALTQTKVKPLYWVWFAGFGWMALTAVRYGVWFLPVEGLLLGMLLSPYVAKRMKPREMFNVQIINRIIGVLLILFPIALLPGLRGLWWQQAPPVNSATTPVAAVDWLKQNPQYSGNLWSDFTFSTYLTYSLPERRLFMTNRFEDFPSEQFNDNKRIAEADSDWQQVLDRYQINLIMPSVENQPDLITAADASPDWVEIYHDDQAYLFARVSPLPVEE